MQVKTIGDLEEAIFKREGIRIIIRKDKSDSIYAEYSNRPKTADNYSVRIWLTRRVSQYIGTYDVEVIDGSGLPARPGMTLGEVRASYQTKNTPKEK